MAVLKTVTTHRFIGSSSETKPTNVVGADPVPQGSTFYEWDTGVLYITYDGTNWVDKTGAYGGAQRPQYQIKTATSAALANTLAPGLGFRLLRIELTINIAGTTDEDFTLDLDAGDGAAYDVNLLTQNTKVPAITSLIVPFGKGYEFEADDEIDAAWPNTENRTFGLRWVYELI